MTILLYDYCDLEERASKHLKAWKVWHILLFVCAAIFGLMNYVFLQKTMELVEHNCVLYPRFLDFGLVDVTASPYFNETDVVFANGVKDEDEKVKRNVNTNGTDEIEGNVTASEVPEPVNTTHRIALVPSRMISLSYNDCQYAEYMPLLSTVFAAVWVTMFTMCAGGGHVRNGLQQPWRILPPALLFSLLMVALTGYSFVITNGGIHAFCAEFHRFTNTTTCSPVNDYLVLGWNATWGFGGRAASTRAASAGVLASWACATALCLARCLAAPDFDVRRTGAYLKDPQQKLTPYIKKSRSSQQRSNPSSPRQRPRDDVSLKSEPTITTELVTVENEQDSAPTSLMVTPVKISELRNTENIEMAYSPRERPDSLR